MVDQTTPTRTIGSIVAEDFRNAAVFNTHQIDFCCKGGRTLEEVCRSKGLDQATIEKELKEATDRTSDAQEDVRSWTLSRLIEHIERVHHRYVEARTPTLLQFLDKLCKVHGERHPELYAIQREFQEGAGAMAAHMQKEELVLFPFIQQLEKARIHGTTAPLPNFGTVNNPIAVMEHEHEAEGERFRRIADLSQGYCSPADGCTTYATAMAMLKEFEEDLHRHVHLENNILFPRAAEMERTKPATSGNVA
ncbi:MAG: iron-sulfur cluster repair di-iron protein [Flavobacteriales bacterium]|nr:iron-sulfur cluster repair di-iron protein [Flavobacteriales bacterium]